MTDGINVEMQEKSMIKSGQKVQQLMSLKYSHREDKMFLFFCLVI